MSKILSGYRADLPTLSAFFEKEKLRFPDAVQLVRQTVIVVDEMDGEVVVGGIGKVIFLPQGAFTLQ